MTWLDVIVALMRIVIPWKGRLALTFVFGVVRVLAYIGVGAMSALIVFALKNGTGYEQYLLWLWILAPMAGIVHWLESWVAHDMAFRLLAEMRIGAFRKLDALAPAYLVRRRTGDLMSLATHDIELIEYFFAHTVAPAFVAVLVPTLVMLVLGLQNPWIALALAPFSCRRHDQSLSDAWPRRPAWFASSRGRGRTRRLCRGFSPGDRRDRFLPG